VNETVNPCALVRSPRWIASTSPGR
jgi:hypothetical protein